MTQYLPRDIRQIKLTNGEEILTEVVGEDLPLERDGSRRAG